MALKEISTRTESDGCRTLSLPSLPFFDLKEQLLHSCGCDTLISSASESRHRAETCESFFLGKGFPSLMLLRAKKIKRKMTGHSSKHSAGSLAPVICRLTLQSYKILQDATRCYKMLQDATRCYKMLQDATRCYKMLQDATRCYKMLQDATRCYKMLQDATRCYKML